MVGTVGSIDDRIYGMTSLKEILAVATEKHATDVHLSTGTAPEVRLNGNIVSGNSKEPLRQEMIIALLDGLWTPDVKARYLGVNDAEGKDVDFGYSFGERARLRVSVGRDLRGPYASIRIIPFKIPEIADLGFPNDVWRDITNLEQGLVLVTGVTGSGKSTTLASLIQEIHRTKKSRIICIEDPIEYVHPRTSPTIIQREIPHHTPRFYDALRSAMRQDPDVILVGEIRDYESAKIVLQAADTGHLVFSTLHTKDAKGTIERILNMVPHDTEREGADSLNETLASNLQYVLSQQLVPAETMPEERRVGGNVVLAMEVMFKTTGIASMIRKGSTQKIYNDIQTGADNKMITMDANLESLWKEGCISSETFLSRAHYREYVAPKLLA